MKSSYLHEDNTVNIYGGLGDIFCKLIYDDFANHQIRSRNGILNIFSDNVGCYELFKFSGFDTINFYPYAEVHETCNVVGNKFINIGLSKDELKFFEHISTNKNICVFHPFTSTPYKVMPENIDKQKFIDLLIDRYNQTVVLLNQDTEVKFGGTPFVVQETFEYRKPGLFVVQDYTNNISRLGFNITTKLANRIIALDSAYIMLRNAIKEQKTLALFWEGRTEHEHGFATNHYFVRGLNKFPNMYVYYSDISSVDSLLENFMERH